MAALGVRAVLEHVMVSTGGDQGTFPLNLAKFEELGHVSRVQRSRLDTILDAGHAAMHRAYIPSAEEVATLLDITEHILASVYIHGSRVDALREAVPPRKPRGKS